MVAPKSDRGRNCRDPSLVRGAIDGAEENDKTKEEGENAQLVQGIAEADNIEYVEEDSKIKLPKVYLNTPFYSI